MTTTRGRRPLRRPILSLATHDQRMVTVRQVADFLQVNEQIVWKWIKSGTLEAMPLPGGTGGRQRCFWRIPIDALRAFVTQNRFTTS